MLLVPPPHFLIAFARPRFLLPSSSSLPHFSRFPPRLERASLLPARENAAKRRWEKSVRHGVTKPRSVGRVANGEGGGGGEITRNEPQLRSPPFPQMGRNANGCRMGNQGAEGRKLIQMPRFPPLFFRRPIHVIFWGDFSYLVRHGRTGACFSSCTLTRLLWCAPPHSPFATLPSPLFHASVGRFLSCRPVAQV